MGIVLVRGIIFFNCRPAASVDLDPPDQGQLALPLICRRQQYCTGPIRERAIGRRRRGLDGRKFFLSQTDQNLLIALHGSRSAGPWPDARGLVAWGSCTLGTASPPFSVGRKC